MVVSARKMSSTLTLTVTGVVTKQKWGLAACHRAQGYSEDGGWWEGEEVFIKMFHSLVEWGQPDSRPISSAKHRQGPSILQKTETPNHAQEIDSTLVCPLEPGTPGF